MPYDAIIVGARVAGSVTDMLLARKGCKVLLVDKASFPSDTVSTHYIHIAGISRLKQWGLLDRLVATGCPAVNDVEFDFGELRFSGSPTPSSDGVRDAYAPRRTVLDKLLVDAAVGAGCELREGYSVDEIVSQDGRITGIRSDGRVDTAAIVIGADGHHSLVARAADTLMYDSRGVLGCFYYAYWSGLNIPDVKLRIRPHHTVIHFPTNDGLTLALVEFSIAEFPRVRLDHEAAYLEMLPEWIRAGRRETRVVGTGDLPNFYRRPFGPGWALVGDAGYVKDPLSAQGITDAFRDAELLSRALTSDGSRDEALGAYEQQRNSETRALYDYTCQRASYAPPPPEMMQLMQAISRSQDDIERLMGVDAGTVRCDDFFHPDNIARIMSRAMGAHS
jgi:flavin-dependent dehydrogenase